MARRREGHGIKRIARELGLDPKTVRQVARGQAGKVQKPPRPSLLDPYRPLIRELVLVKELSAVRVVEEIESLGYSGGVTIVKDFIRTFRTKPLIQPHLRFETGPGEQGQVDLSPYTVLLGQVPTAVVCFSFVLGFSRWQYIRFVLSADVHSVCHSHSLAFEEAGGVPYEILYDRMKQVVIVSLRDRVVLHALFEKLSAYYGFRPVPLAPGYKEGKGKVENPFRYVEGNFLAGRCFHDLADLNAKAQWWLRERARVRIHGTTREQPLQRLEQERPHLLPLPDKRFDAALVLPRVVGDDFCVAYSTNRYSVDPDYCGHSVLIRVLEGVLEVEVGGAVVASHRIRAAAHRRFILPEHEAAFRERSSSSRVLAAQFARLGSAAQQFAEGLRQSRGGAAGYHMGQILRLADRVGVLRVAEALRHAHRYGAYDWRSIERIIAGKKPPLTTTRSDAAAPVPQRIREYLRGAGSFQRPVEAYLPPSSSTDNQEKNDGK